MSAKLRQITIHERTHDFELVVSWDNDRRHAVAVEKDCSPWQLLGALHQLLGAIRDVDSQRGHWL